LHKTPSPVVARGKHKVPQY